MPEPAAVAGYRRQERWEQVCGILNDALDLPPGDRADFIDTVCASDPELRDEVDSLLRSHQQAGSFVPDPIGVALPPAGCDPPDPERIGPYRVESHLGEGGMGTVYLAVRADREFEKRVAVKILRADLADADLADRFRGERQILARLEHPNVARLLDGGTTDDARPYLVMEYVEGLPIDRYCEENHLGLDQRLELFTKICSAVQVAHQNLVVHRDLKPANILVAEDGEPKLLDFGIAKLLRPEGFPHAQVATLPGLSPMTLSHASPEQFRGEPVTTASDIYSLGVVLYQLLAGRLPYAASGGHDLHRLAAEICDLDPVRPSSVAARAPRWRRRLAGDLDAVVLKALAKEAPHRYASAEQLASDLGRYRQGLPVIARGQAWRYRAGKFLLRHRLAVAAASLVAVLTLGFIVTLLIQRREIERKQQGSEEVARMMVELFDNADPDRALGERLTARDLVDRGARSMKGRLEDEPEVRALLLSTLARVHRQLGMLDEMEPLLEETLQLRTRTLGPRHHSVAETLNQLGDRNYLAGNYARAIERYRESQAILGKRPGAPLALALRGLARAQQARGDLEAAAETFQRSLSVAREALGDNDPAVAKILQSRARLELQRGELEASRQSFESALAIYRRAYGEQHSEVAGTLQNIALVLTESELFEQADSLFVQALELQRQLYDRPHPSLATTLNGLATSLLQQGQIKEAEPLAREALNVRIQVYGAPHSKVARSINLLGLIRDTAGDRDEAEEHFRKAVDMWRLLRGPDHPELVGGLMNLGDLLIKTDRLESGAQHLEEALRVSLLTYGRDHVESATVATVLGKARKLQGDLEGAETLYRQALPVLEVALGGQHSRVATLHQNLGVLLQKADRLSEAEAELRQALAIYRAIHGDGHLYVAVTLKNLATVLRDAGRYAEAEPVVREALEIYARVIPPDQLDAHPWVVLARKVLASILSGQSAMSLRAVGVSLSTETS